MSTGKKLIFFFKFSNFPLYTLYLCTFTSFFFSLLLLFTWKGSCFIIYWSITVKVNYKGAVNVPFRVAPQGKGKVQYVFTENKLNALTEFSFKANHNLYKAISNSMQCHICNDDKQLYILNSYMSRPDTTEMLCVLKWALKCEMSFCHGSDLQLDGDLNNLVMIIWGSSYSQSTFIGD